MRRSRGSTMDASSMGVHREPRKAPGCQCGSRAPKRQTLRDALWPCEYLDAYFRAQRAKLGTTKVARIADRRDVSAARGRQMA